MCYTHNVFTNLYLISLALLKCFLFQGGRPPSWRFKHGDRCVKFKQNTLMTSFFQIFTVSISNYVYPNCFVIFNIFFLFCCDCVVAYRTLIFIQITENMFTFSMLLLLRAECLRHHYGYIQRLISFLKWLENVQFIIIFLSLCIVW